MEVNINWEHGDADFKTNSSFNMPIDKLHRFLDYIFDMKGWVSNSGYNNLGFFEDGHYQKESKHVNEINNQYNNEFDDYLVADKRFSYPRASIDAIWLNDGNKTLHIVWNKCLEENLIKLPKIGDILTVSVGRIDGYGKETFGDKYEKYSYYQDIDLLPLEKGNDNYKKVEAKIIDIGINYDNCEKYKSDFTSFHYVILYEYEGLKFTSSIRGFDPELPPNADFLFFH